MRSKFVGNNQFSGMTIEDRFWQKVNKKNDDECWEWLGHKHHQWRYGAFSINNKFYAAHRYSWELHFGDIPDGLLVCHKCDNPPCVNPNHLFLGTNKDNVDDKMRKGRHPSSVGSLNSRSILNEQAVKVIRYICGNKLATRRRVSEIYGVSKPTIDAIMSRRNWSFVP